MLSYAFQVAMSSLESRGFRNEVLSSLVKLYRNLQTPDYVNMCQCLIFLDDPKTVAEVLEKLSKDSEVSFSLFKFRFLKLMISSLGKAQSLKLIVCKSFLVFAVHQTGFGTRVCCGQQAMGCWRINISALLQIQGHRQHLVFLFWTVIIRR